MALLTMRGRGAPTEAAKTMHPSDVTWVWAEKLVFSRTGPVTQHYSSLASSKDLRSLGHDGLIIGAGLSGFVPPGTQHPPRLLIYMEQLTSLQSLWADARSCIRPAPRHTYSAVEDGAGSRDAPGSLA